MKIYVHFEYDSDVLECPDRIAEYLLSYQIEFDAWTVEKDEINDLDHLIDYINNRYVKPEEEKIRIIERGIFPTQEQKKLPHLLY